ncbi:acetyltransferase [Rhabdochromatium marinum]|uniref:acetyltransferase n=1 Tax=Rhabdochromatium marinum TaxID=48729 RepID=UPI001907BC4F|nr:acetyltransferase [Rhabdochromatium marinum]MBK1649663.1 acetyltransferase [Rhabdochromatium marinum]
MTDYDLFNGDADGLCALQQLRLAEPRDSHLVTGVKRDITLLKRVTPAPGDRLTVLDISLDSNRDDLLRVLEVGAQVRWFDHHYAGAIPSHPQLDAHIDPCPDQGTSLLVNTFLGGRFLPWALVGTFGDNFDARAEPLAKAAGLSAQDTQALRELGILLNYNGYGAQVSDLHVAPDELFRRLHPYTDPREFIATSDTFSQLRAGHAEDMAHAQALTPSLETPQLALLHLPAAPWARRVSGVLGNALAQQAPERAHALLTELADGGGYLVSVRAPLARPDGADALCRQFATGGGRKAAAGINRLPDSDYEAFVAAFRAAFT